jgi:transglutaminase superfamily protein
VAHNLAPALLAMNEARLQPHISYCFVGPERIFLDTEADSYFRLAPGDEELFRLIEAEPNAPMPPKLANAAILAASGEGRPIAPTRYGLPISSLVEGAPLRTGLGIADVAEVGLDTLAACLAARRGMLEEFVKSAGRSRKAAGRETPAVELEVAKFLGARKFVPVAPNCLRDSLALNRFLARRGISSDVVIGVKLHPFAAHCWVQKESAVLNDSLSAATGFSPILVL